MTELLQLRNAFSIMLVIVNDVFNKVVQISSEICEWKEPKRKKI